MVAATEYGLLIAQPVWIQKKRCLEKAFTEMGKGFIFTEEVWIKRTLFPVLVLSERFWGLLTATEIK